VNEYAGSCLHELVERQAAFSGDAVAIRHCDTTLTLGDLNRKANWLAHHLRARGIGPGHRVGIHLDRSPTLVVALLGILKAGAAFVPLDPSYPHDRLAFMVSDADLAVIIAQEPYAISHKYRGVAVISPSPSESELKQCDENPIRAAMASDTAYIMYTSGSTGQPKGVVISHRAIVNNVLWMLTHFQIGVSDCVLQKTAISFDPAVWEIFVSLVAGARLVFPQTHLHRDPTYIIALMRKERVTILNCVPSFLSLLLDSGHLGACVTLRNCFCGGEVLSPHLVRRFQASHAAQLHNMYGPTEVAITSMSFSVPRGRLTPLIPIGSPAANVQAFVFNEEGQQVPRGEPGELYLGGPQLADGYHKRPDLTEQRFVVNEIDPRRKIRLFRTGDKVRIRPDGNFEFLGRLDDQFKLFGSRIEPAEIEVLLRGCSDVRDAVVMARPDPAGNMQLVAYVQVNRASRLESSDLRQRLQRTLPVYMVPTQFIIVDTFPLTPSGKIDRSALPAMGEVPAVTALLVGASTEDELRAIWTSVLGIKDVRAEDNFFDLGGHSLGAILVVSQIKQRMGVDIALGDVFSFPTFAQLTTRIDLTRSKCGTTCTVVKMNQTIGRKTIYFVNFDPSTFWLGQLFEGRYPASALEARWPAAWRQALEHNDHAALPCMQQLAAPYVEALVQDTQASECVLVGYSFRGVLALEIGQQLQSRGRHVDAIVLLDSNIALSNRLRLTWSRWRHRWKIRTSAASFIRNAFARTRKDIEPSNIFDENGEVLPWHLVLKMFRTAQLSYQAHPIDARGLLFIGAESENHAGCDIAAVWRPLFRKGLDVVSVPGDHVSMIRGEENLSNLAKKIAIALQENQGKMKPAANQYKHANAQTG
jgi:amino acid adenylation domain-containing protein